MSDIFVISDTHFNHANILGFKTANGNLMRPDFKNVDHMNQVMIENWNAVVKPRDIVIHVGDVIFGLPEFYGVILSKLNGRKTLIMGNHDYNAAQFIPYFDSIRASLATKNQFKKDLLFTHYPTSDYSIYPNSLNIHGHIHEKKIDNETYVNVSVERTNYKPIPLEDILDDKFK